jgi:hypothetical protein
MPHVGHQHVAPEARGQCLLAVLAGARTQTVGEPHHAVRPFGESWCAGD